ncbi:MAG: MFS transporter [Bacteroidales bacterium]
MGYGVSKPDLGYIYFGVSLAIIAGSSLSSWLLHRLKKDEKKFLAVSQIFMAAGMIVCCVPNLFALSVFALLFHEFARGLFAPIKDDYINQSIPEKSKERATLLSIESIFHHIGGVIGLIASGFIAKYLLIPNTWLIFGGFLAVATLLISRNGKK